MGYRDDQIRVLDCAQVNNKLRDAEAESGMIGSGISHFAVQSKLSVLNGELARAEQLLLQQASEPCRVCP